MSQLAPSYSVRLLSDSRRDAIIASLAARAGFGSRFDGIGAGAVSARFDQAETKFRQLALAFIEKQVYATLIPPLKARTFIPTSVKASPGAETHTFYRLTRTGVARLIFGRAVDLPRSSFYQEPITRKFYPIGTSFEFSYFDLLAVGMALENGMPVDLVGENMRAALEAIEKKLDLIAAFGTAAPPNSNGLEQEADPGLLGLLNAANTTAYTIATGAAGSTTWAQKTADEILADLNGIVGNQVSSTYEVHRPDTLIVPLAQAEQQLTRRMSDVSGETIGSFFMRTRKEMGSPVQIVPWQFAAGIGAGSTDVVVAYKRDPMMLEHILAMDATPLTNLAEQRGLQTITPVVAKTAGLALRYPLSVSIGAGI